MKKCLSTVLLLLAMSSAADAATNPNVKEWGISKGLCVLVGVPGNGSPNSVADLVWNTELTIYVQSPDARAVRAVREAAYSAGLLGTRVFAAKGGYARIHLADNLADVIVVAKAAEKRVNERELRRVLHPGARALYRGKIITKPAARDMDDWTHPSHGPDNNLVSGDKRAFSPFMTQYMAEPYFGASPQVTVVSGGRLFRAYGNFAANYGSSQVQNTLVAMNSYNGIILWKKKISNSFVANRNTMVATPDILYMGDEVSCKRLKADTGEVIDEILPDTGVKGVKCWKWLALKGKTLYALLGGQDSVAEKRGYLSVKNLGGSSGAGTYRGGWGRGTLLLAIDVDSKKTLWKKELSVAINGRALCMDGDRLYYHAPPGRVVALDAKTGNEVWTNNDGDLNKNVLAARSGGFVRFFPYESSLFVTDNILYLSGRAAKNIVAMAADTGKLLWHRPVKGQRPHLFVRGREAFFLDNGVCTVLDVASGKPRRTFAFSAAGCSRVTANQELALAWYTPGTVFFNLETGEKGVFKPMRPGCTDGVVTANGVLHWGPWHCGCVVETYGSIGLATARSTGFDSPKSRLEKPARAVVASGGKNTDAKDWVAYRADNAGSAYLPVKLSFAPSLKWDYKTSGTPTAPVAGSGRVLVGDSSGVIHSLNERSGVLTHKSYTGGRIYFPPAIREGRYYFGSSDGWIYCHDLGSGSLVWRFRAAPKERRIMSFGKISSTWPVRCNVLLHDGILYAAAGAHDYDGTYIYALDADKGDLKWRRDASSGKRRVHLMGHLLAHKDAIYVASGYETHFAGYEMSTGKPVESKMPAVKTLGAILSSSPSRWRSLEGGRELYVLDDAVYAWGRSLEIPQELLDSYFGGIAGSDKYVIARESRAGARSPQQITFRLRGKADGKGNKLVWQATIKDDRQIEGLVLTANAVLAVYSGPGSSGGGILMIDVSNGKIVWEKKFEAAVVPWGIAISRNGSIILSLADNRVLCFDAGS